MADHPDSPLSDGRLTLQPVSSLPTSFTIAAAFAHDRDARYAIDLIASSPEIDAQFTRRNVLGERGDVQMVVLEATVSNPAQVSRVETCMVGAHGVPIPS